ncbi:methyl-accepting chemotaxis protein [Rhizobium leguminosarum]|nr:methyl-accepting chemotaxis protein [Rhizobium leguminosarum]
MSGIRNHVREWGPSWLYGVSIIVGALVIWFGKLYDANIIWVTAVPVGLMLFYAAVNAGLPGLRVRNEQTGDNLYYMGFVYTLVSLGISLFKFTGDSSIEDIVRNFGIAIISTVSGILLRILFNQMRRDPLDIERAVRSELAEMTRKVRTELDSSALEFSSYRRTSNQMLSEGFEEIARQAEKNGEAVRAAIEAMSLKATQTLQETADRLVLTLEETHRRVSEIADNNVATAASMTERLESAVVKVTERAEGLSVAIDSATEKYSSARSPDEVLRLDVAPVVEALRTIVDSNVTAIAENAAGTREAAKKVMAAISPFKQTAANLNSLAGKIGEANNASDRSVKALTDVLAGVSKAVNAMSDVTEKQAASTAEIAKLVEVVTANAASTRQAEEEARKQSASMETTPARLFESHGGDQSGSLPEQGADEKIVLDGLRADDARSSPGDGGEELPTEEENATAKIERPRWTLFNR